MSGLGFGNVDNTFALLGEALRVTPPADYYLNEHRLNITHLIAERDVDRDYSVALCGAVSFVLEREGLYDLCPDCVRGAA